MTPDLDLDDDAGNRLDAPDLDDNLGNEATGQEGNRVEGGTARGVLTYIVRALASDPDGAVIETSEGRGTRLRVHVAPGDMGRMIGRRGRVAQAIRTLVRVAASRDGSDATVDFVDD